MIPCDMFSWRVERTVFAAVDTGLAKGAIAIGEINYWKFSTTFDEYVLGAGLNTVAAASASFKKKRF